LLVAVAAGVAVRWPLLETTPFWVDEAESTINGLTILDKGYPADEYLGIPIFENTLVRPWPDHPEYAFRDLSYSDKGFAVYHGWLPLYAIAASLKLHGIEGGPARRSPFRAAPLDGLKRLTEAARLPGVVFAVAYIVVCYLAGRSIYGRDAGFAASLGAALFTADIDLSVQARYYSAQVFLGTASVYATWMVWNQGRWRDYLGAAVIFGLLFFTHLTTFVAALIVFGVFAGFSCAQRPGSLVRLAVFAVLVGGPAAAWVFATGFLNQMGWIPPARDYLQLPEDLLTYSIAKTTNVVLVGCFAAAILAATLRKHSIPERFAAPLRQAAPGFTLLALWIVVSYSVFLWSIPAASLFDNRLRYGYRGASVLLAAVFFSTLGRMLAQRVSIRAALIVGAILVVVNGSSIAAPKRQHKTWSAVTAFLEYIEQTGVDRYQRLYAIPNSHLILAVYSGLPWQSITPIRRSFLDSLQGEILFADFEDLPLAEEYLAPERLLQAAMESNVYLGKDEASRLSETLMLAYYVDPPGSRFRADFSVRAETPEYVSSLFEEARRKRETQLELGPIFRGYHARNWREWVKIWHYRFVAPENRENANADLSARFQNGQVDLLVKSGWVFIRTDPAADDRHFSFLY
jgi:hypothetical protein